MAISRLTNWADGDVLTSAALEAEFDNIYNNGLAVVSPWTANMVAGGFILTGLGAGSVSAPSLSPTGDANTGVFFSAADTVAIAAGGVAVLTAGLESGGGVVHVRSTAAGAVGPFISLDHVSASPADSDDAGGLYCTALDDGAAVRIIGSIIYEFQDVTATTMDSAIFFSVMDNVNANNVNTTASLTSLGVWTDASAGANKEYIGDMDDVLDKLGKLKTLGVYHSKDLPADKKAGAERHYSPTAEDFYSVFGLGRDPRMGNPGIAPKDLACLAIKGLMELEQRVKALEP